MTGRVTCDSSVLVAMLVDGGDAGRWAAETLSGAEGLLAPQLATFEVANILRRHAMAKLISEEQAMQAHADLLELDIELWPYELIAARAWELRGNLTIYDASYVALAEATDTDLVTLDQRIQGAPGLRCRVSSLPDPQEKGRPRRSRPF